MTIPYRQGTLLGGIFTIIGLLGLLYVFLTEAGSQFSQSEPEYTYIIKESVYQNEELLDREVDL